MTDVFSQKCRAIVDSDDMNILQEHVSNGIIEEDTHFYLINTAAYKGKYEFVKYLLPLYRGNVAFHVMIAAISGDHANIVYYVCSMSEHFATYLQAYAISSRHNKLVVMHTLMQQIKQLFPDKVLLVVSIALGHAIHTKNDKMLKLLKIHADGLDWQEAIDRALTYGGLSIDSFDDLLLAGADVGYNNYNCFRITYPITKDQIKKRINAVSRCQ